MISVPCHLCSGPLTRIEGYARLGGVTSDCRPWPAGGDLACCDACGTVQKPLTPDWHDEAGRIYGGYRIYSQSGGREQKVFTDGAGAARSVRLLDIGCGNGGLLASAAARLPGWRLTGTELSDRHRAEIEAIPGVEAFHSGDGSLAAAEGPYDLVSLVHCLEHIPDPIGFLRGLAGKFAGGGHLVIEVPDFTRNPFDLLIADHCTHFSPAGLRHAAAEAGFAADLLSGEVVPKELTFIGHAGPAGGEAPLSASASAAAARAAVVWLEGVLRQAETLAARRPFGLFGTAIAAMWLEGCLPGRVDFFVDEDPDRVGGEIAGRPVLAPSGVPADAAVFVPLAPSVAAQVCARLGPAFVAPERFDPAI